MAQGDFWDFGVAYPLKNHKFRHPSRLSLTLSSAVSAGGTQLNFGTNQYHAIHPFLKRDDYLEIGTTTSETAQVDTVTANSGGQAIITLKSALAAGYASGQTVVAYGTKLAGGWSIPNESTRIYPVSAMPYERGASDNYAQILRNGASQDGLQVITQNLSATKLLPQTEYRFGGMYQADIDSNSDASVLSRFNDSTTTHRRDILVSPEDSDVLSWTRFEDTFWCTNTEGSSTASIQLGIDAQRAHSALFMVDDIFLEHARNIGNVNGRIKNVQSAGGNFWAVTLYDSSVSDWTASTLVWISAPDGTWAIGVIFNVGSSNNLLISSGQFGSTSAFQQDAEIREFNSGYYQFAERPLSSSLAYDRIESTSLISSMNGGPALYDRHGIGDRSERWFLTGRFTAVSQAIFDNMLKFMWYQENGNLINVHPYYDDLPTVLTGKMRIKDINKSSTPFFTVVDFTIDFEEVLI